MKRSKMQCCPECSKVMVAYVGGQSFCRECGGVFDREDLYF